MNSTQRLHEQHGFPTLKLFIEFAMNVFKMILSFILIYKDHKRHYCHGEQNLVSITQNVAFELDSLSINF